MLNAWLKKHEPIAIGCFLFLAATTVVWVRTLTVKSTYQFVRSKKKLEGLETDVQLLKLKWTKATSVVQLNHLAKVLGFHPLEKNQGYKVKTYLLTEK